MVMMNRAKSATLPGTDFNSIEWLAAYLDWKREQ
jgi:hypothetical protein